MLKSFGHDDWIMVLTLVSLLPTAGTVGEKYGPPQADSLRSSLHCIVPLLWQESYMAPVDIYGISNPSPSPKRLKFVGLLRSPICISDGSLELVLL